MTSYHAPRHGIRAATLVAALIAVVAVTGCARRPATPGPTGERQSPGAGSVGGGTASATPTGQTATSGGQSTPTATSTTTQGGPQIVSFAVVGNANCGGSGPGYSSPGTVTLSWKVTGANSVGLSIDNPEIIGGYHDGYGLEGTETLPFACGRANATVTHRYTVAAVYPGATKTQTLNVSAVSHG